MARPNKPNAKLAVAYLRVSTDDQQLGPEAQRVAIQRWADARGVTVVSWHEDHGVSGATALDECPSLLMAIDNLVLERAGILVVAKRDRLARDTMKAGMIEALVERQGAVVLSAAGEGEGNDPTSKLMRTIVDAFAEYERALIRSRTKAAMAVMKSRNERVGGIPYGFTLDADKVHLVSNEAEQVVIRKAIELRGSGLSLAKVGEALTALGIAPRKGSGWFPAQIQRMVA